MKEEAKQPEILTIPAPLMQDIMNILRERPLKETYNLVNAIQEQVKPLQEPEEEEAKPKK